VLGRLGSIHIPDKSPTEHSVARRIDFKNDQKKPKFL